VLLVVVMMIGCAPVRVTSGIGLRPLFIVNGSSSDSVEGAKERAPLGEVVRDRCKADVERDP